jgi:hypothetical protein
MSDDRRSFDQADRFFEQAFEGLTGHPPLGWQRRLFAEHFAVLRNILPLLITLPENLSTTQAMMGSLRFVRSVCS